MLCMKDHAAPAATALAPNGTVRSVARRLGHVHRQPLPALQEAGRHKAALAIAVGRVFSGGTFRDPAVHAALSEALGAQFAQRLRPEFEWYVCRGAFFHNDAHYGDVLFGVWCIGGDGELVFPRVQARLNAAPGDIAVFDPFEVHGVLERGATTFEAGRYQEQPTSVFVGFELDCDACVRETFGITAEAGGAVIASATRISPRDGTIG